MNKLKMTAIVKSVQASMTKHKPEILLGIGIATGVTSTVLAVRATPKALSLIEKEINRQNREIVREATKNGNDCCNQISKLTPIDTIKTTWKCYIPATTAGVMSIMCLIGANSVSARRTAALAAAYQISETALSEYREKVIETIGEKKEQVVRDKISRDHVEKNPVSRNQVIITEKGNTLCYDELSGRYFRSDIDRIKRAQNDFNRDLLSEMHKSLNEFYDELGLEHIGIGDDIGWTIDKGMMDLSFSSQLADDDTPCVVIAHRLPPRYDYNRII